MFTRKKTKESGIVSSTGPVKKADRGRVDFFVTRKDDDSLMLSFRDYGNYGKLRWSVDCPIGEDNLVDMVFNLQNVTEGESSSFTQSEETLETPTLSATTKAEPVDDTVYDTITESPKGAETQP